MKTNQRTKKRTFYFIVLAVIFTMVTAAPGFSGDDSNLINKRISKQKGDDFKSSLYKNKNNSRKNRKTYIYSRNQSDFNKVLGTTWQIFYELNGSIVSEFLTVQPVTYIDNEDDYYAVCVNDFSESGNFYVMNSDTGSEKIYDAYAFDCEGNAINYFFEIDGTEAFGNIYFITNGSFSDPIPMFGNLISSECVPVGDDLSLPMCAEYGGIRLGFTLDYFPISSDPDNLYWKMNLDTFSVKE